MNHFIDGILAGVLLSLHVAMTSAMPKINASLIIYNSSTRFPITNIYQFYCTVYSTVLYYIQYCTIYSTVLYTVQYYIQYCTIYSTVLYTVLYYIQVQYYI